MENEHKHYKFIPCKTDDFGMKLEWENESDAPTDGDWNWWMDKDGNVEFARMKEDAYDHFYPPTKHLNLHGTDWEPQSLSGYFKEVVLREMPESIDDENCTTCIHCNLLYNPPVCRINGEYLPNPTGRFCNKYDKKE